MQPSSFRSAAFAALASSLVLACNSAPDKRAKAQAEADPSPGAPEDADSPPDSRAKSANAEDHEAGGSEANAALTPKLQAMKTAFLKKAPQETIDAYEAAIRELEASGITESAIGVGDRAPDFTRPNATGEDTTLSKLLQQGPVVLVWYRGGWCPYCNLTLKGYSDASERLAELGATVVAISPQTPDNSLDTQQKQELPFEVLSDVGNEVAKRYELVFTLPPEVAERYQEKFDLHKYNGDDSNQLPLAATYVVKPNGTVAWAFLDADYRERAEPSDVIAAVAGLDSGS